MVTQNSKPCPRMTLSGVKTQNYLFVPACPACPAKPQVLARVKCSWYLFHRGISRIVSTQPAFKSYWGTKPSSFCMRLPSTAISSVYLSIISCVTGGFIPMERHPFSTKPTNARVGPTGNENRGGLQPRAEQMDSIISFKVSQFKNSKRNIFG